MEFTRILRLHGLRPKNERRISMKKHPLLRTALLVMTAAALLFARRKIGAVLGANSMYGTFWALVPPVIAITLALITKEAYSSLFIGVTVGALFSQGFSPIGALNMIVNDGLVAAIEAELGTPVTLLLTGGGGKYVTAHLTHPHTFDPDLTRKGLALLYEMNRP